MARLLLLAAALLAAAARVVSGDTQGLAEAVRKGERARAAELLRGGADPDASTPSGWTPLMEAAARGDAPIARLLLDAGADADARDRRAGTALDVAQAGRHDEVARLLRSRGSRGSGKSIGDQVCVLRWQGSGYCGVVEAIDGTRYRLRLTRISGCQHGCVADAACSSGRPVGGSEPDRVAAPESLWVRSWCLTHTGLDRSAPR
jgi:hypothetical protein